MRDEKSKKKNCHVFGDKTDSGYEVTENKSQLLISDGNPSEFAALWLNGEELVEHEYYEKIADFSGRYIEIEIMGDIFKKGKTGSGTGTGSGSGSFGSGGGGSSSGPGSSKSGTSPSGNASSDNTCVKDETGWKCQRSDNTWFINGWGLIAYNGITGWQLIDGKWYYLNEQADGTQGALLVNTQIGEYRVNEDRVWVE